MVILFILKFYLKNISGACTTFDPKEIQVQQRSGFFFHSLYVSILQCSAGDPESTAKKHRKQRAVREDNQRRGTGRNPDTTVLIGR